ncbi:MAG TPA: aldo/keto reductase, partial [Acidimicrobiia bacterium]
MLETRTVGTLEVSRAGLGCNNFGARIDQEVSNAVVDAAFDAGINHFDTADVYSGGKSEEFLGQALRSRRAEVVITTKVGSNPPGGLSGGSAEWVAQGCEASLKRLRTDYIDLYLLHTPDPNTPITETLEALAKLVAAGKVREIGCSNFTGTMIEEADAAAKDLGVPAFVNAQNDYSLLQRAPEAEVIPVCQRLGMSLMPYFPLASGVLTGKYTRGEPAPEGSRLAVWGAQGAHFTSDARMAMVEQLDDYARAHGHTLHELALSWLAGQPAVASV